MSENFDSQQIDLKAAEQKVLELLARREHSLIELRHKLAAREFPLDIIEAVLQKAIAQGWQSDERFTENYIQARKNRGYGPTRIRQELQERGVDAAVIDAHLFEDDEDWFTMAIHERIKKFGEALPTDFSDRAKQMKFLQYRGFTMTQIRWVFK